MLTLTHRVSSGAHMYHPRGPPSSPCRWPVASVRYGPLVTIEGCSCLICSDSAPTRDSHTVELVRDHGWSVLRIAGGIEFAYTIGLWHSFRRPEAVMFGLDGQGMQHWLNAYVDHAREQGWP